MTHLLAKFLLIGSFAIGTSVSFATDLIVIINKEATPPTKEQIADIYLGKNQAWVPWDQSDSSKNYADFYSKMTGRDIAQIKATWSRIIFTGKGKAPKQLADSELIKKAVAENPKAIGYIEKAALDSTVKAVLSLE